MLAFRSGCPADCAVLLDALQQRFESHPRRTLNNHATCSTSCIQTKSTYATGFERNCLSFTPPHTQTRGRRRPSRGGRRARRACRCRSRSLGGPCLAPAHQRVAARKPSERPDSRPRRPAGGERSSEDGGGAGCGGGCGGDTRAGEQSGRTGVAVDDPAGRGERKREYMFQYMARRYNSPG